MTTPGAVTSVVCPPWCGETQADHLDESGGGVDPIVHWSLGREAPGWDVHDALTTLADGTPAGMPPGVVAETTTEQEFLSLDQAEAFAHAILAAVEEARS